MIEGWENLENLNMTRGSSLKHDGACQEASGRKVLSALAPNSFKISFWNHIRIWIGHKNLNPRYVLLEPDNILFINISFLCDFQ